jgi:DNA ligase-1
MKFKTLVTYFEKLEETSSRLALIDILVELFTNLEKKEVEKVIYLLQGRVAPFYAPVEIGMADKMVAQAIALAYGSSKEDVLKRNDKTGDMGLVAKEEGEKHKQTHCKNGHALSGNNLAKWGLKLNKRKCVICHNKKTRRARLKARNK